MHCTSWLSFSALAYVVTFTNGLVVNYERRTRANHVNNYKHFDLGQILEFQGLQPPPKVRARHSESVVLHCEAGTKPAPTIHWLYKGNRIPQGRNNVFDDSAAYEHRNVKDHRPRLEMSETVSRLYIDCVTPEDAGEYTCIAENPFGRIDRTTVLTVDPNISDEFVDSCVRKRGNEGTPARIVMWTQQRLEFQGLDVQLFCRAEGTPTPSVRWYDNRGEEVTQDNSDFTLLSNGDLLVRHISWERHMGDYRCVADNGLGTDEVDMFLYPTSL